MDSNQKDDKNVNNRNKNSKKIVRPPWNSSTKIDRDEFSNGFNNFPKRLEKLPQDLKPNNESVSLVVKPRLLFNNDHVKIKKYVYVPQGELPACGAASLLGILRSFNIPENRVENLKEVWQRFRHPEGGDDSGVALVENGKEIKDWVNSYLQEYRIKKSYTEPFTLYRRDVNMQRSYQGKKSLEAFENYIAENLSNNAPVLLAMKMKMVDAATLVFGRFDHAVLITGLTKKSSPYESSYKLMNPNDPKEGTLIDGQEIADALKEGGYITIMGLKSVASNKFWIKFNRFDFIREKIEKLQNQEIVGNQDLIASYYHDLDSDFDDSDSEFSD